MVLSAGALSVGVLVDLPWRTQAGGHVKCWERFAQAATTLGDDLEIPLDLTIHFLGDEPGEKILSPQVRYRFHRPHWGSDRIPFLKDVADQTDLAPFHPGLVPHLLRHDVIHATHQLFSFGQTALHLTQRHGLPLVASIHTDVPHYTEIYTQAVVHKLLGHGKPGGLLAKALIQGYQLPQRRRQAMEQTLGRYWPHCRHVWTSQAQDREAVAQVVPPDRLSHLRRGLDKTLFHPRHRDRPWLQARYGIPHDRLVVLFVGRLNACKNALGAAHTLRLLGEAGLPVHGIFVGLGPQDREIQTLLGSQVTLPGQLEAEDLAPLYASADLFLFPSSTEIYGNVVLEAMASGLPVAISDRGGVKHLLQGSGLDGLIIPNPDPAHWAATLTPWLHNLPALRHLGLTAHRHVHHTWPSWREVLMEDLLPVWQSHGHRLPTPSPKPTALSLPIMRGFMV